MSRTLSSGAVRALTAHETEEVFLTLLTIQHIDLDSPIRIVANNQDIVSRGDSYLALGFEITLPQDDGETIPQVQLSIDNVDREITETIRSLTSSPSITLEVIMASSPDAVELVIYDMMLDSVTYDDTTITGSLVVEDILNQSFPSSVIDPQQYKGLF